MSERSLLGQDVHLYSLAECRDGLRSAFVALQKIRDTEQSHSSEHACTPRHCYPAKVILVLRVPKPGQGVDGGMRIAVATVGRSISQKGLCVLASSVLLPVGDVSDETPVVELDRITKTGVACRCGLFQSASSMMWIDGVVVRLRPLPNAIVELGIQFTGKAQTMPIQMPQGFRTTACPRCGDQDALSASCSECQNRSPELTGALDE